MGCGGAYLIISLFIIALLIPYASATQCWLYDNDQSLCSANSDCQWHEDPWGSWCEEKGCWNLWSENECQNSQSLINKTCTWQSGSSGWCEQVDCWVYSGTTENQCVNNAKGLNCVWENRCMSKRPGLDCWQYDSNKTACQAIEGCQWGDCYRMGCWEADSSTECSHLTGFNGQACRWNSADSYCYEQSCWDYSNVTSCTQNGCQWENGNCYERTCQEWSHTNSSACTNNPAGLNCFWDAASSQCDMKGCWNYHNTDTCNSVNLSGMSCVWNTDDSGWCEEVQCWSFDQTSEDECVNNDAGLNCIWDDMGNLC